MEYGIRELAAMAGVSARTLRWYDSVGLLRPARVGDNGYRFYGAAEVDRLQQILFYRALGVDLKRIASILDDPSFDRMAALRGHLAALERERGRLDGLIASVRRTIQAEEEKVPMKDSEKLEAFKREAVAQNEARYGAEARERYGDAAVDGSNRRIMGMSEAEHARWESLGAEVLARLEAAVTADADPLGAEGRAIAELHREWLCFVWERYTPQAHAGVAQMYVLDPRFTEYYDRRVAGCAAFLRDAVAGMVKN